MLPRRVGTIGFILCYLGPSLYGQNLGGYVTRTIAGAFPLGDGGPATSALLETPQAVAVDAGGNLFIADSGNRVIRKVSRGVISTLPGYTGYAYDLKLDSAGNLYIAAYYYVYKLTQAGVLTTVAGNGNTDNTGDGGPATAAAFRGIYSIALDSANNLYIADYGNHRIRKVTAADHCCPRQDRPVAGPAENTRLGGTPVGYLGGGLRFEISRPVQVIPKPG